MVQRRQCSNALPTTTIEHSPHFPLSILNQDGFVPKDNQRKLSTIICEKFRIFAPNLERLHITLKLHVHLDHTVTRADLARGEGVHH